MTDTQTILDAARQLGRQISSHPASQQLEAAVSRLRDDQDAQRLLNDYNRHVQAVAEKEMKQQPIEVEDKARLRDLQTKVVTNEVLRELQKAQMDYVDLMRQVDEAITGQVAGAEMTGQEGIAAPGSIHAPGAGQAG